MGKYFSIVDGKAHDWKFTKLDMGPDQNPIWNFYLGETYVGQIFELGSGWAPTPFHTQCPFGGVDGFATRRAAAKYMLQVCGFTKHPDQRDAERMESLGFVPVRVEEYIELTLAKRKLEAAEQKLN
jgi:hypothetical protein